MVAIWRQTGANRWRQIVAMLGIIGLLLVAVGLVVSGCSGNSTTGGGGTTSPSSPGTSTVASTATSPSTSIEITTSTTLPKMITPVQQDLATTAQVMNSLQVALQSSNAPSNDPRQALIYGLRARENALSSLQAISDKDFTIADVAMTNVYSLLNQGRTLAQGSVANILGEAYKTIENLGSPSSAPDQATKLLQQFVAQLKPLISDAQTLVGSSTTGSSTTGSS